MHSNHQEITGDSNYDVAGDILCGSAEFPQSKAPALPNEMLPYRLYDLTSIEPRQLSGDPFWESLRLAHVDAAAMFIEMYDEIFFLARDCEFLYYTTTALARGEQARVHLINVSSESQSDSLLLPYLVERGLTTDLLESSLKTVIIDTGFKGSVIDEIRLLYPEHLRKAMLSRLVCSTVEAHPSTRAFLQYLESSSELNPGEMEGLLRPYEGLPHGTSKCYCYENLNGVISPVYPRATPRAGATLEENVSLAGSMGILADIRHLAEQPEAQSRFEQQRKRWREVRSLLDSGTREQLMSHLQTLLRTNGSIEITLFVRDVIELTGFYPSREQIKLSPTDLDLVPITKQDLHDELRRTNPELERLLFDPGVELPLAVRMNSWGLVKMLIDRLHTFSQSFPRQGLTVRKVLARSLGSKAPDTKALQLLEYWLKVDEDGAAPYIASQVFSFPESAAWQSLFQRLVTLEQDTLIQLILHACSFPHVQNWKNEISQLRQNARGYTRDLVLERLKEQ